MAISQKLMKKINIRKQCDEEFPDAAHAAVCSHCDNKLQLRHAEISLQIIDQAMVDLKERSAKWEYDFEAWRSSWRTHLSELSFDNVLARVYGYDYLTARSRISQHGEDEFTMMDFPSLETQSELGSEVNSEFECPLATPVLAEIRDEVKIFTDKKCFFE